MKNLGHTSFHTWTTHGYIHAPHNFILFFSSYTLLSPSTLTNLNIKELFFQEQPNYAQSMGTQM